MRAVVVAALVAATFAQTHQEFNFSSGFYDNGGLVNGKPVWLDIGGVWRDVPEWMEAVDYVVTYKTWTFPHNLKCFGTYGVDSCMAYVFVYPCLDCPDYEHGDYIKALISEGYESFNCAPSVEFPSNFPHSPHRMAVFRKHMGGNRRYVAGQIGTQLAATGLEKNPPICDVMSEAQCLSSKGRCVWANNNCEENFCRSTGYGPHMQCTTNCLTEDPGLKE
ncbi:hypothetical protein DIPPA_06954 [Diplonema papillatum]|nr:hypothetical protein DIPPA_06954 [Diplonema papillatum]